LLEGHKLQSASITKPDPQPIMTSGIERMYQGKVRDIYILPHVPKKLVMVATDRFSSFDRHLCDVPGKGWVVNHVSFLFQRLLEINDIPTHFTPTIRQNVTAVKECIPLPLEIVVRAYITGSTSTSLWTRYAAGHRTYCGITFPDGLVKNQALEELVITPTTKSATHDRPVSSDQIVEEELLFTPEAFELFTGENLGDKRKEPDFKKVCRHLLNEIYNTALRIFKIGQKVAAKAGLILVDTKYEFGIDPDGHICVIDEVHTPDSSRFWEAASYKERFESGKDPVSLDKDIIRNYIKGSGVDPYSDETLLPIPQDLIDHTSKVYKMFYERIAPFLDPTGQYPLGREEDSLPVDHVLKTIKLAVSEIFIVTSNPSHPNLESLLGHCVDLGHAVYPLGLSIFRQTSRCLEIVEMFNSLMASKPLVLIVLEEAGSFALSGVFASNCERLPVIVCTPRLGPSPPEGVPLMVVDTPLNAALAADRILKLAFKNLFG